jgi:predicted DNA repair protein MutK
MAGGLVGLLDDVAALAKLAASSVDDVGAAAGKASMKAAGVVVDDAAVTPGYVKDLAAERELPIIRRIAVGSLRNKVLFILPAALLLSEIAPKVVEVLLMGGGAFLCYEGAHKVIHALRRDDHDHDVPAAVRGPEAEAAVVSGAIRTDFILSAEIMVIALKEVLEEGLAARAAILVIVAVAITAVVYGAVALIVKMDDVGIALIQRGPGRTARLGRLLVTGMPRLLAVLSVVGTAAMLWVGGHLLLASADELGWSWPYDLVHDLEHAVHDVGGVGGVLGWLANTGASAVVGLVVGSLLVGVVSLLPFGKGGHPAH